MSTSFDILVESALVLTGPLLALDETTLVGTAGNMLRVIDGPSGTAYLPPPPTGADGGIGGFTALTVAPSLSVVAAATSGRNASVWVFRAGSGGGPLNVVDGTSDPNAPLAAVTAAAALGTPLVRLAPSAGDLVLSALAISADGSRVAAVGGLPDFSLSLWDGATGIGVTLTPPVQLPTGAVVTAAAFAPDDRGVLALGGPGGLWIVSLAAAAGGGGAIKGMLAQAQSPPLSSKVPTNAPAALETTLGAAATLAYDSAQIATLLGVPMGGGGGIIPTPPRSETCADAVYAIVEERALAAIVEGPRAALNTATRVGAPCLVADARGANHWVALAWPLGNKETRLVASTLAGHVCAYDAGRTVVADTAAAGKKLIAAITVEAAHLSQAARAFIIPSHLDLEKSSKNSSSKNEVKSKIFCSALAPLSAPSPGSNAPAPPPGVLIAGLSDGTVVLLNVRDLSVIAAAQCGGEGKGIVAVAPRVARVDGGADVWVTTEDGALHAVTLAVGGGATTAISSAVKTVANGAPTGIVTSAVIPSARGGVPKGEALVVTAGADGDITLWSRAWGSARASASLGIRRRITVLCAHSQAPLLGVGCDDGAVAIFVRGSDDTLSCAHIERVHAGAVTALTWGTASRGGGGGLTCVYR